MENSSEANLNDLNSFKDPPHLYRGHVPQVAHLLLEVLEVLKLQKLMEFHCFKNIYSSGLISLINID